MTETSLIVTLSKQWNKQTNVIIFAGGNFVKLIVGKTSQARVIFTMLLPLIWVLFLRDFSQIVQYPENEKN